MNTEKWLSLATRFELGKCTYHNRLITIERRKNTTGVKFWVLKMDEWLLGKDGKFHYEPRHSNRTDKFLNNTLFDTPDACYQFWKKHITSQHELYANEPSEAITTKTSVTAANNKWELAIEEYLLKNMKIISKGSKPLGRI